LGSYCAIILHSLWRPTRDTADKGAPDMDESMDTEGVGSVGYQVE
jgi:hypothetical protein